MNCRYFACEDCKSYIDAGYRWAYWFLECPSIAQLGGTIDAADIFAAVDYWNPSAEERADWLVREVLPAVRAFLLAHEEHSLRYVEEQYFDEVTGYEQLPTKSNA